MATVKTVNCTQDKTSKDLCPHFQKTFSILGKKWNGLILEVLIDGPHRFKDIAGSIPKCSDRVLVERLKELEGEGIVDRVTHPNSSLIEYQLTDKGQGLNQVLTAAHAWGDEWLTDEECVDAIA
ncbi:winged helix-turn-helix transcriptional regulator [Lacticaseibacillus pantheris]|jgi:DNA-binding HxlR family transcriptional regulator|uniref:Transcriptional regulator n=1 Tax=Lacticaseibacillus pantheris DSM 15945 = JCM 12539 = NBRC 106106 TaxID=1423783 RepID=A0A0R1U1T2_9LACO|nr:winged helix-turn-helix transcriptional regulator [Lacticaseibacillus pantheris]KRL86862.1 transcriptional regulator [Lacticaseibacillus pantheris DSM 15945 = JCM 12539 = NBRC 106106]WKF84542.1 winged helix-turn-helix transcriptional regulator [Lacticaseibacillus pantheris]